MRDRETAIHRGRRLRERPRTSEAKAQAQLELFAALAEGDRERVSAAREALERLDHTVRD